jgi:hypothetical protein
MNIDEKLDECERLLAEPKAIDFATLAMIVKLLIEVCREIKSRR